MKKTAHDYFLAAFRKLIDEAGRGAQKSLSLQTGKSTVHINDVLRGRKKASQEMQEEIASSFGLNFEEMLAMGRALLEEDEQAFFPYTRQIEHLPQNSPARAAAIYRLTAEEFEITGLHWFTEPAIKHANPPGVDDYLNGKIDDLGLYEEAKKEIQRMVALIEAHLEKRKKLKK